MPFLPTFPVVKAKIAEMRSAQAPRGQGNAPARERCFVHPVTGNPVRFARKR